MKLNTLQIDKYRRCIMRELKLRKNVYPYRVKNGRMKQEQADDEIKTMEEIKNYFDYLQIHADPVQQSLFKS